MVRAQRPVGATKEYAGQGPVTVTRQPHARSGRAIVRTWSRNRFSVRRGTRYAASSKHRHGAFRGIEAIADVSRHVVQRVGQGADMLIQRRGLLPHGVALADLRFQERPPGCAVIRGGMGPVPRELSRQLARRLWRAGDAHAPFDAAGHLLHRRAQLIGVPLHLAARAIEAGEDGEHLHRHHRIVTQAGIDHRLMRDADRRHPVQIFEATFERRLAVDRQRHVRDDEPGAQAKWHDARPLGAGQTRLARRHRGGVSGHARRSRRRCRQRCGEWSWRWSRLEQGQSRPEQA